MSDSAPSRTRIVAAFAAIYLIWGSTYLGIRFAIETIPPFLMGGVRFMLAGAILYLSHALARTATPDTPPVAEHCDRRRFSHTWR